MAVVSSVLTVGIGVVSIFLDDKSFTWPLVNPYMIADGFLLAAIAFGAYRKSRICFILLIALFAINTYVLLQNKITSTTSSLGLICIYWYFQGLRGSITYHKIVGQMHPRWPWTMRVLVILCTALICISASVVVGYFFLVPSSFVLITPDKAKHGDVEIVNIGSVPIRITPPKDTFRLDGRTDKADQCFNMATPSFNKLLRMFGSADDLKSILNNETPKMKRSYILLVSKSLESKIFTPDMFNEMLPTLRKQFERSTILPREWYKDYNSRASSIASNISEKQINLQIEDSINLGMFDETPQSFCCAVLMRFQFQEEQSLSPQNGYYISAMGILFVHGKVFYIYANSIYNGQEDINWAVNSVTRWRESILDAN